MQQPSGEDQQPTPPQPEGGLDPSPPPTPEAAPKPDEGREAAAEVRDEIRPVDPWAHRRGEPRVFAFVWTIYLFLATVLVLFTAMAGQAVDPEVIRPAVRLLLLLAAAGIGILWPMVRLSQVPDPEPVVGAMKDFVIVIVPVQALIWPQTMWWLARWPLTTVLALAASLAVWSLLVAGLLALVQAGHVSWTKPRPPPRPVRNAGWMLAFVVLSFGGVVVSLFVSGTLPGLGAGAVRSSPAASTALMVSPIGSVIELTRDVGWMGRSTPITRLHWVLVGVIAATGVVVWAGALARGRRERFGLRFPLET